MFEIIDIKEKLSYDNKAREKLAIFAIFVLIFLINLNSPISYDDFYFLGNDFSLHYYVDFYKNHSARFLANMIAGIIVNMSPIIAHLIVSLVFVLVVYLLYFLVASIISVKHSSQIFFLVFVLYWILHPNIDSSNFWLTGSGHYLFSSLFFLIYVYVYCLAIANVSAFNKLLLIIFALLSSASQEAFGFMTVLITLVINLFLLSRSQIITTHVFISSFFTILGFSTLVLAPNSIVSFDIISNIQNIDNLILSKILVRYCLMFVIALVLYFLYFLQKRDVHLWHENTIHTHRNLGLLATLCFSAGLIAFVATLCLNVPNSDDYVASFVLFNIGIACLLHALNISKWKYSVLLFICIFVFFIQSYAKKYNFYALNNTQNDIINMHLIFERNNNNKKPTVPKLVRTFINQGVHIDDNARNNYYGFNNTNTQEVQFNWTGMMNRPLQDIAIEDNVLGITHIYYSGSDPWIDASLVFAYKNTFGDGDELLLLTMYMQDSSTLYSTFKASNLKLLNNLYTGLYIQDFDPKHIKSIKIEVIEQNKK